MGATSDRRVDRLNSLGAPDVMKGKAEHLQVIVDEFSNPDTLIRKGQRATDPGENLGPLASNSDPFESFVDKIGQPKVTGSNNYFDRDISV